MEQRHRRDPGKDWTEPSRSPEPTEAPASLEDAADIVLSGIAGSEVMGSYHRTESGEWLDTRTGEIHKVIPSLGTDDQTPRHHLKRLHDASGKSGD